MNQESTYDFVIKSYESDFKGNISLPAFFLLLQECEWENAKKNGFGYEFVEEESALWVLSKVKLKIISLPKWKDKIEIEWAMNCTDDSWAYFIIDFMVSDNIIRLFHP